MQTLIVWLEVIFIVFLCIWIWNTAASACDTPRPAECRVYEDTHTCISRLDERRREIENAVARALTNLE